MNRQESQSQQSSSSSDNGRYADRDRDRDRDRERGQNEGGNVMSTSLNGGYIEKGSYDNGDPTTTNLYLGNLAPTTTGMYYYSFQHCFPDSEFREFVIQKIFTCK